MTINTPATHREETVETMGWDNRQLLLRIYYQVVETNGTVRTHEREIFGDPHLGCVGLRQIATENLAYREKAKVVTRVAVWIAGALITMLGTMLGLILEHVL